MTDRHFTLPDQLAFADLSGDFNPMHVDPVGARRMLFGKPVVHGIHLLMWVLDQYCSASDCGNQRYRLRSVKATFTKPVGVGEAVRWSISKREPAEDMLNQRIDLALHVDGVMVTRIKTTWAAADDQGMQTHARLELPSVGSGETTPASPADMDSAHGVIPLWLHWDHVQARFPSLVSCLSPLQLAEILALTRLVGMVCPGLNSVFSELDVSFTGGPSTLVEPVGGLSFGVTLFDRRFSRLTLDVSAPGMAGRLLAFERPPIGMQPAYAQVTAVLAAHLSASHAAGDRAIQSAHPVATTPPDVSSPSKLPQVAPFTGQRALVVGGSRGLGEVTAKLLAAGGADVKLTYRLGVDEANHIVDDIRKGGGLAAALALDVLNAQAFDETLGSGWKPTHLYYLATPYIFDAAAGVFSDRLFRQFSDYYVTGFAMLVKQLHPHGMTTAFYPSSSALDELPATMGEYVAAKAAGEALCGFLERHHRGLVIHKPRLPRLATDQTVNLLPVENADPLQAMLTQLMVVAAPRS